MPKRATESSSGYRKYRYGGRELASVTSILGAAVAKQGPLVPWAAKMVATCAVEEFAKLSNLLETIGPEDTIDWLKKAQYRSKKAAGLRGTNIHEIAEAHAKGLPLPPVSPAAVPYVRPLLEFLADYAPEPIHVEESAFSPTHGYAGTLDSIAKFDKLGTRILDFKTSAGVYSETALQLVALAHADFLEVDGAEVPIPPLDGGLIVHIAPTGYALYEADISDETFEYFLAAIKMAHFGTNYGKHVLQSI